MYHILVFFSLLFGVSLQAFPSDDEDKKSQLPVSSQISNSLEGLSDYSFTTIEKADLAFLLGENEELENLHEPLLYAAQKRYKYSLSQYAHWVLGPKHLLESKTVKKDIYDAANCLLMAAYRGEESSQEYILSLEDRAKAINKNREASLGIMDTLREEDHEARKNWLKGQYPEYNKSSPSIRRAQDLLFLCLLSEIDQSVFEDAGKKLDLKIQQLTREKGDELRGRRVVDIHYHATVNLNLKTSRPKTSSQKVSETTKKGDDYPYYNTRVKYPYSLDVGAQTWNKALGNQSFTDGDVRFIKTDSEIMAAGPVYKSLRKWKKPKKSVKLPVTTAEIVEMFYPTFIEFFDNNPLWLVEITHLEDPWKSVDAYRKEKGWTWPKMEKKTSRQPFAEVSKKKELNDLFKKEFAKFIESGESLKSISYRLFMIGVLEKLNNEVQMEVPKADDPFEDSEKNEEKKRIIEPSKKEGKRMKITN